MNDAYPMTPDDDIAAMKREAAEFYSRHDEFFDAADDYDRHRAFPTRPPDADLLPPNLRPHTHRGCGHGCQGCASVTEPLCVTCFLDDYDAGERHSSRYRPLHKAVRT